MNKITVFITFENRDNIIILIKKIISLIIIRPKKSVTNKLQFKLPQTNIIDI